MIIMRRIILALSILALTACAQDPRDAEPRADHDAAVSPAARAAAAAVDTVAAARAARPAPPAGATSNGAAEPHDGVATGTVLFVGTSLTAGYGVGEAVAYPARIQEKIEAAGLPFRVRNAGISGETSAAGLRRIDWSLQQPADVLVLELGANDGLRGLPVAQLRSNLDAILTRARAAQPGMALVIIGMEAPPNLGEVYTTAFRDVYTELAARHGAALVPFLLDGVAADPSLNIQDGIHPNAEGHRIMAATVWETLEPVLRRRATQPLTGAERVPSNESS
jgi:acyl-CoA thioesterase I